MEKCKGAIMVQGTMSGVGKSLLVAGLCRLLSQEGLRACPFKSQNMALNSFITREGLEMGRAQVMQAQAAGLEPDVRMNPILLKPTRDSASQVIVNGQVEGTMAARDYFRTKKSRMPQILEAYESLRSEMDVMVIEGAGSPAEINLKKDDIVNMGLATALQVPVLLVGDIDRGGVFAQLYGTLALLEKQERDLVRGLVINKFRGDRSLLEPGVAMLEEKCQKPVAGVVPYLPLTLEDEDSLSERFTRKKEGRVRVVVLRLPRISNYTDFDPFEDVEGVSLTYAASPGDLNGADLIILPGTKNTLADLRWLKERGLAGTLLERAQKGALIIGICGGYQMLGERLLDPLAVEEGGGEQGLGLLPVCTEFTKEKIRTQVEGVFQEICGPFAPLSGKKVTGYEIHMGESAGQSGEEILKITDTVSGRKKADGCCQGNVLGTYLHGLFDEPEILKTLMEIVAKRKGIDPEEFTVRDHRKRRQEQFNLLADTLRQNLDIKLLYQLIQEGGGRVGD